MMLFALQRYEFFSKSQQYSATLLKDYDVVCPAKVRIFQQITTNLCVFLDESTMLFALQRYEFFSKSQLSFKRRISVLDVVYPAKSPKFVVHSGANKHRKSLISNRKE